MKKLVVLIASLVSLSGLCFAHGEESQIQAVNFTIVNNSSLDVTYQYVNTENYSDSFTIKSGSSATIPSNDPSGKTITPVLLQGNLSQSNYLLSLPLQLSVTYPYSCKIILTLNVTIDGGTIYASPAMQINVSKLYIGATSSEFTLKNGVLSGTFTISQY